MDNIEERYRNSEGDHSEELPTLHDEDTDWDEYTEPMLLIDILFVLASVLFGIFIGAGIYTIAMFLI